MFVYRLKNEFVENRNWVAAWVVFLIFQVISLGMWWMEEPSDVSDLLQILASVGPLFGISVFLGMCYLVFKRDDLKDPEAFWATRPVRALPMFGAKFLFLQLVITLPLAVMVLVAGCILGEVSVAGWNAVEVCFWGLFLTGLFGFSAMAYGGSKRVYAVVGLFGAGMIVAAMLLGSRLVVGFDQFMAEGVTFRQNWFLALVLLSVVFSLGVFWLARDKHRRVRWWIAPLVGFCVVVLCAFVRLPVFVGGVEEVEVSGVTIGTEEPVEMQSASSVVYGGVPGYRFDYPMSIPAEIVSSGDYQIVRSDLEIIGSDDSMLRLTADGSGSVVRKNVESSEFAGWLRMRVMKEAIYDESSGSSSSVGQDESKRLRAIEQRVVQVRGYIDVRIDGYEEVHRGELDEGFEYDGGGLVVKFDPKAIGQYGSRHRGVLLEKRYKPSLLITPSRGYATEVKMKAVNGEIALDAEGGSASGGGSFWGRWWYRDQSFEGLEHGSSWYHLQAGNRVLDFAEWREGAELVVEARVRSKVVRVSVDVEILVPDLDVVGGMLE